MSALRFISAGILFTGFIMASSAQYDGFLLGRWIGPAQLIQTEIVQNDLKLDEQQIKQVMKWATDFLAKYREKLAVLLKLPSDERREKIVSLLAESRKIAYEELGKILKPEKLERLRQIERRASGVKVLLDEETAGPLKMTDDQRSKVKETVKKIDEELQSAFSESKGSKEKFSSKENFEKLWRQRLDLEATGLMRIKELLTSEQQKAWEKQVGEPIDLAKLHQEIARQLPQPKEKLPQPKEKKEK